MGQLTLIYADEPAGAKEGTTASVSSVQEFCDPSSVLRFGNTVPQYATFEDGYWILGRDFRLFPAQPEQVGWGVFSGEIAGPDGVFEHPIVLTLELDALYSAVAMSFSFDPYGPTWCTQMRVEWWRDEVLLSEADYAPDGWQFTCHNIVRSFNRVTVTFSRMSQGYRFLKLQSLTYGITRTFGGNELFALDLFQDTDLISNEVTVNTMNFTLRNTSGTAFLFQRKQVMRLTEGEELLGLYYISDHEQTGENRYNVSLVDMVGLAEMAGDHPGGVYEGVRAADLVSDILGDLPWRMDPELENVPIYGWLPIAGKRDNLQQVAFALGAMVRTARRDYIEITRPSTAELKGSFAGEGKYENGKVKTGGLVTAVKVTAHRYTKKTEVETLYDESLDGTEEIEFSEPVWGLEIAGGTLLDSGANFARFSGSGEVVTLTGKKYDHSKRVYTKRNPLVTANDAEKPVSYSDMTLVSPYNAASVLENCYRYNLRVDRVMGKILTGTQAPGDYVSILTETSGVRTGHLLSLDYVISAKTAAEAVVLADYVEEDVLPEPEGPEQGGEKTG